MASRGRSTPSWFETTKRILNCTPGEPAPSRRASRPPVGAPGLEPGTSALSGPRSNHLSYAPPRPCRQRERLVQGSRSVSPQRTELGPPYAQDEARVMRSQQFTPALDTAWRRRTPRAHGAPAGLSTRRSEECPGARCPYCHASLHVGLTRSVSVSPAIPKGTRSSRSHSLERR
jgi:hypothetical protein